MGRIDRQKMAEAAERVMRRSNTEITEVVEKDEDKDLTLSDRFAATLAAFFVCGGTYFAMWLLMMAKAGSWTGDAQADVWLWIWTWRAPFLATAITTLATFLKPGWALRCFGKLAKAFSAAL